MMTRGIVFICMIAIAYPAFSQHTATNANTGGGPCSFPSIPSNNIQWHPATTTTNNTQQQVYQQQADKYLDAANNAGDNPIQKAMYLNWAKTYAMAAGNQAQLQQIEQMQQQMQMPQPLPSQIPHEERPGQNGTDPATDAGNQYQEQYGDQHNELHISNADHDKVSNITNDHSLDSLNFDNAANANAAIAPNTADNKKQPISTGRRIHQNVVGGNGFSNKVIYDDAYVTVSYSLQLIRRATSYYLQSNGSSIVTDDNGSHVVINNDSIDFTGFYYRAQCLILNKQNKKLHIYGYINATPGFSDVTHISATGWVGHDFGFDQSGSTFGDHFYYSWDLLLTNKNYTNVGNFWTEVPDELPFLKIQIIPQQ